MSCRLPFIKAISHLTLLINKSNINFCFIKLSIVITQAKVVIYCIMLLPGVLPLPILTFYIITHVVYRIIIDPCMYEQIHWHPQKERYFHWELHARSKWVVFEEGKASAMGKMTAEWPLFSLLPLASCNMIVIASTLNFRQMSVHPSWSMAILTPERGFMHQSCLTLLVGKITHEMFWSIISVHFSWVLD